MNIGKLQEFKGFNSQESAGNRAKFTRNLRRSLGYSLLKHKHPGIAGPAPDKLGTANLINLLF